jgi:hypothetical protein
MASDLVTRFAPFLRFDADERHFLATPDEFRDHGRFRRSLEGKDDLGWNVRAQEWQKSNGHGADFVGAEWARIKQEIALATKQTRPDGVAFDGPVTRPQDERNLWGEGKRIGFFLELEEGFGHDASGAPPQDFVSPAPVFHDVYDFTGERVAKWIALSYWFFYIYNWNNMFKHEGDWEHITLYFAAGEGLELPRAIFYAAHNSGSLISGRSPVYVPDTADETTHGGPPSAAATHPIVYVMRHGHPSYPIVDDPKRYPLCARSWQQKIPALGEEWREFDGAWGEVGDFFGHTTGPLGPWFKRGKDVLRTGGLL